MDSRTAIDILKNANLGGVLREAADYAIKLLEAQEQGRLVVLPCQWGTKLYSIFAALHNLLEDGEPPIREVQLVENNVCAIIRQFGKTVFLTREEAEAALRAKK